MQQHKDYIDQLIALVLLQEANAEQQEELKLWQKQSPENEQYVQEAEKLFRIISVNEQPSFNREIAWEKVRAQIAGESKYIVPIYIKYAAAAVLVILCSVMAYRFWFDNERKPVQIVAIDSVKSTWLPDSTLLTLQPNSSIVYDKNDFENEKRIILSGEAFFDINKHDKKKLTVQCQDIFIQDIGTRFNVKAYHDSTLLIVSVTSGRVHLFRVNEEGVQIEAGEEGVYNKKNGQFSKRKLSEPNIAAYHDRILIFDNTSLRDALQLLEKLYNTAIKLDKESIGNCRFSATFNNEKLETILEVLAETLSLSVEQKNSEFLLKGEGCYESR